MELTPEQIAKLEKALDLYIKGQALFPLISEELDMVAASGTNDLDFKQLKADRIAVITNMGGYDDVSSPTKVRLGYYDGASYKVIKSLPAPIISESVDWSGFMILRQGWIPRVRFEGATAGDDLYAHINGFYVKL